MPDDAEYDGISQQTKNKWSIVYQEQSSEYVPIWSAIFRCTVDLSGRMWWGRRLGVDDDSRQDDELNIDPNR